MSLTIEVPANLSRNPHQVVRIILRSACESFNEDKGAYLWKTVATNIFPKLMIAAAATGVAGQTLKRIIDGMSEYDKSMYNVIPIGVNEKGKSIYFRILEDSTPGLGYNRPQDVPTASRLVDPPKAGLVLKHQPDHSGFLANDLGDESGKFFLKARCRSQLTSGCRRRGAILRQPCRASIR